jgi:hypothetical protein
MNRTTQIRTAGPAVEPGGGDSSQAAAGSVPQVADELGHLIAEIRHQDFAKLEEAVETFARAPRTNSGFPTVRPEDCRKVIEAFDKYLQVHRSRFLQNDPVLPERFFGVLDRFAALDIRAYPNEVAQLQVVRIEALVLAGRNTAALELSTPIAERPYLIEGDPSSLRKFLELDTLARLNAGRRAEVDAVALGRLLLLIQAQRRGARQLYKKFFSMLATSAADDPQYSRLEGIVLFAARLRLALRLRKKGQAIFMAIAEWPMSVLAAWTLRFIAWRTSHLRIQVLDGTGTLASCPPTEQNPTSEVLHDRGTAGDILVTRAMGGLGDIMMMTPGLTALAKRTGRPVHFATKRQFFPLLENNPDIHLLDIDGIIDVRRYRRWVNLSFCPAARYESRVTPKIKKGRVELFAGAMGIKRKTLDRSGWRPVCQLNEEQRIERDEFHARFGSEGLPVIGVQPYSRETYRNYPWIFEAMSRLAERARIVYFHTSPVSVAAHPNVLQMHGQSLRETLPAIAACDYLTHRWAATHQSSRTLRSDRCAEGILLRALLEERRHALLCHKRAGQRLLGQHSARRSHAIVRSANANLPESGEDDII